jgi:hypothetical protein
MAFANMLKPSRRAMQNPATARRLMVMRMVQRFFTQFALCFILSTLAASLVVSSPAAKLAARINSQTFQAAAALGAH